MRAAAALCLLIAACGQGAAELSPPDAGELPDASVVQPSPDAGSPDAGPALHEGVLFGVRGARYVSGATRGITDGGGAFQWEDGARVAFYSGGLELADIEPVPLLTPFALSGSCSAGPLLRKLLVLLATLDGASPDAKVLAGKKLADVDLSAALAQLAPGKPIADENAALDSFIAQIDGEDWQAAGVDKFSAADAATRSQGVVAIGSEYWFSWRLGISRTALDYSIQAKNDVAIPAQLALLEGINHIGDIAVRDGTLYASFEDGTKYKHPRVGFYDAQTLAFRSSVALDVALQPDGVPWVEVWNGMLVTSRWNPITELHLWDMAGNFLRAVPIRPQQSRFQGLKIQNGMAYAARDTDPKVIVKIDVETGTVLDLFPVPDTGELEGLAVLGETIHTLGIAPGATSSELRHWKRARAPLREQVCR
jgi:hypothetical protein